VRAWVRPFAGDVDRRALSNESVFQFSIRSGNRVTVSGRLVMRWFGVAPDGFTTKRSNGGNVPLPNSQRFPVKRLWRNEPKGKYLLVGSVGR
jgi:hypothetical protein